MIHMLELNSMMNMQIITNILICITQYCITINSSIDKYFSVKNLILLITTTVIRTLNKSKLGSI